MAVEIKIPSVGESISEVVVAQWLKKDGDYVEKDEPIMEMETDKVNQELNAPDAGILRTSASEGDTLAVGDVAGTIEPGDGDGASEKKESKKDEPGKEKDKKTDDASAAESAGEEEGEAEEHHEESRKRISPVARKVAEEHGVDISKIEGHGSGGRIMKEDVLAYVEKQKSAPKEQEPERKAEAPRKHEPALRESVSREQRGETPAAPHAKPGGRETSRERLTQLRKRIASRLVEAQQTAAILTTFNEVDMSAVMSIRAKYKDSFKEKHGVGLGFMSFFVKAAVEALKEFPRINAYLQEDEILYHHYYDIGVAVGTDRGLVVPVIRNAESLSFAGIESTIRNFAKRAQEGKLTLEELTGGTFSISNGGVYGSMMSTPILNPPQSGILGMHNITERPMAIDGKVEIRPMMYLALSYDHRIVDGKEAVTFLRRIKECIESPERLMLEV